MIEMPLRLFEWIISGLIASSVLAFLLVLHVNPAIGVQLCGICWISTLLATDHPCFAKLYLPEK
jgi:hypothetical protein